MGWIIGIIVAFVFIQTLVEFMPPQVWVVLAVIIVAVVVWIIARGKRKKRKTIESPEFQELLRKARRLEAICRKMPEARMVNIDIYDVYDYKEIPTHEGRSKDKPFTLQEANEKSSLYCLYYQVHIRDGMLWIPHSITRYIESHRRMMAHSLEPERQKMLRESRDATGEEIMRSWFGSKEAWEEFSSLTGYDAYDIIFDCMDQCAMFKDDVIFHFGFFCWAFNGNKEKVGLLLKELKKPAAETKHYSNSKAAPSSGKKKSSATGSGGATPPTPGSYRYFQCACGTNIRVPADKGHIIAKCPKPGCPAEWDITPIRIKRIR